MPLAKPAVRVKFRTDVFDQIAESRGLNTYAQKAEFLGVDSSTYSRIARGMIWPGETFVASVLRALAEEHGFDELFEVVEVTTT